MSDHLMGHVSLSHQKLDLKPSERVAQLLGAHAVVAPTTLNPWHRTAELPGAWCVVEFYRYQRGIHLGYHNGSGGWLSFMHCGVISADEVTHWRQYMPVNPPQEGAL